MYVCYLCEDPKQNFPSNQAVAKESEARAWFDLSSSPPPCHRKRPPPCLPLSQTMDEITYNPGLNPGEQRDAKEKVLHHGGRVS